MMEIRTYKPEDLPSVKRLFKEFHEESMREYGLACDPKLLEEAILKDHKHGLALVVDGEVVGMIAGRIVEYPLQNEKIYQEMVWYVTKKYRMHGIKLLRALEAKCKAEGIKMIIMVAMGNSMKEKLDRVYQILGYNELETHYIKTLG